MTVADVGTPGRLLNGPAAHQRIGIGCRSITPSGPHASADDERFLEGLRRAVARGATVLATADAFGLGRSERLIGELLREVPRHQVSIVGSVGGFRGTAPHAYATPHLHHQVRQSLENLGTDYLDVLSLYGTDFGKDNCYLPDAAATVHALRDEGLIRAVGLRLPPKSEPRQRDQGGRQTAALIEELMPDSLCVRYNAVTADTLVDGEDVFSYARRHRIALMLGEPFARGLLTGHYRAGDRLSRAGSGRLRMKTRHQDALPLLDNALQLLRDRLGGDPNALIRAALHYSLRRIGADGVVLAGFACPDHIETNLTAAASPLADDDLAFVIQLYDQLRADWTKHPTGSHLGHDEARQQHP